MKIAAIFVALLACMAPHMDAQDVPGVDIWLSSPPVVLTHGARAVAYAVSDPKAYIAVFQVTSDGRIIMIVPRTPRAAYRVPEGGMRSAGLDASFNTEQVDGVGHLFAAASYTPFDFSRIQSGQSWGARGLSAPAAMSPVDIAEWFVRQIVSTHNATYGMNDVAYYVGVTPPDGADTTAQQSADQSASQFTAPSTVFYMTPGYNDPLYYDQYGYSVYAGGIYPYTLGYGAGLYWYDPYAGNARSGHRKHCPDGSVVPAGSACPTVLPSGQGSGQGHEWQHRMIPRKPTPPHILPTHPMLRPPGVNAQSQVLAPAPLLSPNALDRPPTPHKAQPAAPPAVPRSAPVGVYNRPMVRPAPIATPAPRAAPRPVAPPPSPARPPEQSQKH